MRRLLTTALVIMLFTAGMSAIALAGDGEATTRTRQAKVDVCHYEADTGAFDLINISTKAHQKHMDHGDGVPGDHVPGMAGYEFDETCELVQSEIPGTLSPSHTRILIHPTVDTTRMSTCSSPNWSTRTTMELSQ